MNRRNFLKFLGVATIGSTVAYSFPSIIVPKNIEISPSWYEVDNIFEMLDDELNEAMRVMNEYLNKGFWGDTTDKLFTKFGRPDFYDYSSPSWKGITT